MLSYITGKLVDVKEKGKNTLVIVDVFGFGLSLYTTKNLKNAKLGKKIKLFTHLHIKNDGVEIYGFEKESNLELFKKLISINTVGPKIALHILDANEENSLEQAIQDANLDYFTSIPGVGAKLAKRIIIELKDKLNLKKDFLEKDAQEIIDAIASLGYKKTHVKNVYKELAKSNSLPEKEEDIIKMIIKNL